MKKTVDYSVLAELFSVIKDRQNDDLAGSYTCYLFQQGIDKILKKCGEECTEMIIAAKNNDKSEIINEVSDLFYHILVLLADRDIDIDDIILELNKRTEKQKNLKPTFITDKNS